MLRAPAEFVAYACDHPNTTKGSFVTEIDFEGVLPACVTPFTADGDVDHRELARYAHWLANTDGVTAIVCNAHAGEGLSLTEKERLEVIRTLATEVGGAVPIIAAVGGEGSRVAAREAQAAAAAGASAILLFPAHVWLRMGYQRGAPEDRYRMVADASGIPLVLFVYPDATLATYQLETILHIGSMPEVVAMKTGVRNMARWDTEVPAIRRELPDLKILTCHDEYLLHTMWESDGALVGYGALVPELMVELLRDAKAHDYEAAKAIYDRITPLTQAIYHRTPHVEATAALKAGLVSRGLLSGAVVRSPLLPLAASDNDSIDAALWYAGIESGNRLHVAQAT
jgi:4-hydroxy-tetrahydrodipicolinate synthase